MQQARQLWRDGVHVPLRRQVYDLVHYLALHAGELIPHEKVRSRVWPDVAVSRDAYYRLLHDARMALGDPSGDECLIETVRGRGIRFRASVSVRDPVDSEADVRLGGLSAEARRSLAMGAVLGERFPIRVFRELSAPGLHLKHLDEAVALGLLRHDSSVEVLAFTDPAVRDALLEGVIPTERRRIHEGAVRTLQREASVAPPTFLDAIGAQLGEWAAIDGPDEPIALGIDLATNWERTDQLGPARSMLEQLLDLPGLVAAQRADLYIRLASLLKKLGEVGEMRRCALEAWRSASLEADADLHASALLAAPWSLIHGRVDLEWARAAERTIRALEGPPSPIHAELLNRLAYVTYWSKDPDGAVRYNDEAREMARALGDDRVLAWVALIDHMVHDAPDALDIRFDFAKQAIDYARQTTDIEAELYAREQAAHDALQLADMEEVRAQTLRIERLAERHGHLPWPPRVSTCCALYAGDLAGAERRISAPQEGSRYDQEIRIQYLAPQLFWIRRAQGRFGEVIGLMRSFVARSSDIPIWRASLSLGELSVGDLDAARVEYESLASQDFRDLPDDFLILPTLAFLAIVCVALEDRPRAEVLSERLAIHSGRLVVLPRACVCWGPVDAYRGVLSSLLGKRATATAQLRRALRLVVDTGGRPAEAECRALLAEHYDRLGQVQSSREEATRGARLAAALGLGPIADRCQRLL